MEESKDEECIRSMSDDELLNCILHAIWRIQDAGGVSGGRSRENQLLELAIDLACPHDPVSGVFHDERLLCAEAERRCRALSERRLSKHFDEFAKLTGEST